MDCAQKYCKHKAVQVLTEHRALKVSWYSLVTLINLIVSIVEFLI